MRAVGFSLLAAAVAAFVFAGCGAKKTEVKPAASPGAQASAPKPASPGPGPAGEAKKPAAPDADPAAQGGVKNAIVIVDGMT